MDDPLRMYLVLRRGAVEDLARAAELAGAAAVACVREPSFAEAVAAWRPRPREGLPARAQREPVAPGARGAAPARRRSGRRGGRRAGAAPLEDWVAAGCPGQVLAPSATAFAAAAARPDLVARVADAGLTEVARGTVTVVALPPR
jgi:hypothetical protein